MRLQWPQAKNIGTHLVRLGRRLEQRGAQRRSKVLRLLNRHLAAAGKVALVARDGNQQIAAQDGLQL